MKNTRKNPIFYKKGVDISSVKSMFEFINGHFRYDTMNSWNRMESIANNVKLYNLHLDGDWCTACSYLFDDNDIGDLQSEINTMILEWEKNHPHYSLGFNGRSGGYLVMYNQESDGRVNFRSIVPDYFEGYDTYEEWKENIKEPWYGYNVKDFLRELRDLTQDIRDFDILCDDIRDLVNEYSKMNYEEDREQFRLEYGI